MNQLPIVVEIIGHLTSVAAFASIVSYIIWHRAIIRRTTQRAALIYWLVVVPSVLFALVNAGRLVLLLGWEQPRLEVLAAIDFLAEYPSLMAQGLIVLTIINFKVVAQKRCAPRRVLAIGAHPDDLEIACGGTLAKMHDAGYEVFEIVLTHGEQGGNHCVRPEEARRGARFLGIDHYQVLDFFDTHLTEQANQVSAVVETAISAIQPDIILTHSSNDQHQDHQAVYEATLRAARHQSTILCYESPSVTKDFIPTFFVDIAQYIDIKLESIREHKDQSGKPYVGPERVRAVATFRGGQAKLRAAEGFEVVRLLSSSIGEA